MIKFLTLFLLTFCLVFGLIFWAGSNFENVISSSMGVFVPLVLLTGAGSWYLLSHIDGIAKEVGENDELTRENKKKLQAKFRELKNEVISNVIALVVLLVVEKIASVGMDELKLLTFENSQYAFAGLQAFRVTCLILAIIIVWGQLSSFRHINQYREVISS
ncbi:hypothetical protein OCL06_07380 [Alteromonas sp. ASW11-19]|uniref:DUF2975 domain-containing protein n=1 Tax=Alteromonas salexigens TaxID=2982530 RepID=A0ABT2VMU0_9ALTE|nr:hypothetical protein [Alteromonas salexigens]MCU7554415.1 hypothetical protein [Alteromonas salexigens]